MEDQSWRMRTEMPTPILSNYPPRRSTGYTTNSHLRNTISFDDDILSPAEDFTDVFGGAPRTLLSHQFSTAGFSYEDIFRQQEMAPAPFMRRGRNLPRFRIPSGKKSSSDRYQQNLRLVDIFGWEAERVVRSRSRSKTSSSSALSSEELSPLRPAVSDDGYDDVSSFASKLRPINVRSRWGSTRFGNGDHQLRQQKITHSENHNFLENSSQRNEFGQNMNLEQIANGTFRVCPDDLQFNSPASAVSSLSQSDKDIETSETIDEIPGPDEMELDEDELMSSYVIEINSGYCSDMKCESNGVDEAIAWVKEKFQTQSSEEKPTEEYHLSEGTTDSSPSLDELVTVEETSEVTRMQEEMQLLDEKIRLWSTGKEADIRLLLSSLHHILWPNSGWIPISLTNLIESSQVKKAYQKAVLCLHPDKLQQRSATLLQNYIAEKAFSALQDAWAAFVSPNVFPQMKN